MKKILVFHHINHFNFLLCYVMSFFWEIKTFRFYNKQIKNQLKRVSLFDWNEHCDWEEGTKYIFQKTVKFWDKQVLLIDKDKIFKITIDGEQIDISRKVKKELGGDFQQHHLFQKFGQANEVYIHGLNTYYLQKYTDYPVEKKQNLVLILIDSANIFLEHIGIQVYYSLQHLYRIKNWTIRKCICNE